MDMTFSCQLLMKIPIRLTDAHTSTNRRLSSPLSQMDGHTSHVAEHSDGSDEATDTSSNGRGCHVNSLFRGRDRANTSSPSNKNAHRLLHCVQAVTFCSPRYILSRMVHSVRAVDACSSLVMCEWFVRREAAVQKRQVRFAC